MNPPEYPQHSGCHSCHQPSYLLQHQPYAPLPAPAPSRSNDVVKWVGIAAGASVFLLTVAVAFVAIAIGAVAVTICALVLRSIWNDVNEDRAKKR